MLIVATAAVFAVLAFFIWALATHPHRVHAQNANEVINEVPGGIPDGTVQFFTLKFSPVPATVQLYLNGIRQRPGVDFASYPSTKRIGFFPCCIPQAGDALLVDYFHP